MALFSSHFFSDTLGMCTRCQVLLPDRVDRTRPLPCLYLLHGLSDDETIWMRRTAIERYAGKYQLAIVMPNGDKSFYSDLPSGTCYYKYISQELPSLMESYFGLSRIREDRFIAGLSMGGFGAFKIALANPDRYAAVAGMSSVCSLDWVAKSRGSLYPSIFGGAEPPAENDLYKTSSAVAALPKEQQLKIFQYCGVDDFLWEANLKFRDHLRGLGLCHTWEEGPGGHCWENWDERIQHILAWLPIAENCIKTGAIGI